MATEMKPTLASFASSLTVSHRARQWIEDEKALRLSLDCSHEWSERMPCPGAANGNFHAACFNSLQSPNHS